MERSVARIETAGPPRRSAATHVNRFVVAPENFAAHSPFLMLAEDWFAPPAGFPTHPHRGMETVTLVLEGSMEHRDHTGAHGLIGEGDVQWMTAGRGVMHSEMPGPDGVHSLQLWLNLPADRKMSTARYADQPLDSVHRETGEGYELRCYAGRRGTAELPHGSHYPMGMAAIRLDLGAEVSLNIPSDERGFVYVLEGALGVGADGTSVSAGQIAWIDPASAGADSLVLTATAPAWAVLYHGRPIEEPVVAHGPFVMNTTDEIRQAFEDYQRGEFV